MKCPVRFCNHELEIVYKPRKAGYVLYYCQYCGTRIRVDLAKKALYYKKLAQYGMQGGENGT